LEKVPTLIPLSPRSRIGGAQRLAARQFEPAVRLVAEDPRADRLRQGVDPPQVGGGEDRAGRVVRRVDDDQARARRDERSNSSRS
jgi:hypothetical protein